MRATEFIAEIDRRGFLKGLGALAGASATGSMAAPFRHGTQTDQMTGEKQGNYATVKSNDGSAELFIQWKNKGQSEGTWLDISHGRFFPSDQSIRIKFGDKAPIATSGTVRRNSGNQSMQLGGYGADFSKKILNHSGELKIEVELYNSGKKIFVFNIEPDSITKSIPSSEPKKSKPEKIEPEKSQAEPKSDDSDIKSPERQSAGISSGYAGRLKARIMSNITRQGAGEVSVEIKSSSDGTIISRRLVKSSGDSTWDNNVLKGIDKTSTLPRDIDGRVPSTITLTFGQ